MPAILALAFVLALVPFGIQAEYVYTSGNDLPYNLSLNLERSEAYAEQLEPGDTAYKFLGAMSNYVGMPAANFIVTATGVASLSTGVNLLVDSVAGTPVRMKFGETVSNNLNCLVDAADYPDWSTLDANQQQLWASKQNYDAAKFVSLMHAFGIGTEYERFEQLQASGGGNFEFSDDVKETLSRLKNIGQRWRIGLGNSFADLASTIVDSTVISKFPSVIGEAGSLQFDATDVDGWPSSIPTQVELGFGNTFITTDRTGVLFKETTNVDVYMLAFITSGQRLSETIFSTSEFLYGYGDSTPSYTPGRTTQNGVTFSVGTISSNYSGKVNLNNNFPTNLVNEIPSGNDILQAISLILGGQISSGGEVDSIVDYPDSGPPPAQKMYYPHEGSNGDTTYNTYTTPTTIIRQPNSFNPDNETSTNKWKNDTESNVLPVMNLPLDKLFPFCLLYDVPLVLDKLLGTDSGGLSAQAVSQYRIIKLEIPEMDGIDFPGWEIDFDLEPVEDLLHQIRPALQMLILVTLMASVIAFFKSIITG